MSTNHVNRNDRLAPAQLARRSAFTLIELLVVIGLMSILATMLSYALSSARQEGRIKRTQSEVRMISQILQTKMNEIALSKLELVYSAPANPTVPPVQPNAAGERSRLVVMARRDLMRLVMPECRADLIYPPANLQFRTPNRSAAGSWVANCAKVSVPSEWNRMRRLIELRSAGQVDNVYQQLSNSALSPSEVPGIDSATLYLANGDFTNAVATTTTASGDRIEKLWTRQYESAECLYLILSSTDLFGETAIDKIHARSIANLDGDAVPEIIDPWGRPYEFIRDPIGLETPAIKNYNPSAVAANQYPVDPDPLDFLLSDWRYNVTPPSLPAEKFYPIYLPPVVISAGADGEFDIRRSYYKDDLGNDQGVNWNYSTAVITWNSTELEPLYPFGGAVLPYRFPDPYYNVAAVPYVEPTDINDPTASTASAYAITNGDLGQVDLAKQGGRGPSGVDPDEGGLGSFFGRDKDDASADNITSLDGGF